VSKRDAVGGKFYFCRVISVQAKKPIGALRVRDSRARVSNGRNNNNDGSNYGTTSRKVKNEKARFLTGVICFSNLGQSDILRQMLESQYYLKEKLGRSTSCHSQSWLLVGQ
jgi:hypothetical protein